jgi:hypothetical protein
MGCSVYIRGVHCHDCAIPPAQAQAVTAYVETCAAKERTLDSVMLALLVLEAVCFCTGCCVYLAVLMRRFNRCVSGVGGGEEWAGRGARRRMHAALLR